MTTTDRRRARRARGADDAARYRAALEGIVQTAMLVRDAARAGGVDAAEFSPSYLIGYIRGVCDELFVSRPSAAAPRADVDDAPVRAALQSFGNEGR